RTEYLFREAKRRSHILEGQLIAISSLDEEIAICRTNPSRAESKERLKYLDVSAAVMRHQLGDEQLTALLSELGTLGVYRITDAGVKVDMEDLIAEEMQVVTISHQGYIKRLPLTTYRTQHRGGKGVSGGSTREDDFIEHFFVASTHAYLLCFTNRGRLYWLKVYDIPQMSRTSPGRAIANVLSPRQGEKISSLIPVRHFEDNG